MSTSSAPSAASTQPPTSSKYPLPALPSVAGASPDRAALDGFRLAVAKLVADAWEEDVAKVFAGVDTGQWGFVSCQDNKEERGADEG